MSIEIQWILFCKNILTCQAVTYSSIRKFARNKTMVVDGKEWNKGLNISYQDMGYGLRSTKETQLRRNYFNEEECIKLNEKLRDRINSGKKQTSVSLILNNETKRKDSQGFCMMGMVVSHYIRNKKDYIFIDINYRITEIFQKFLADLKFLNEVVIPEVMRDIDIEIDTVQFNFSNCYASIMFLPVVYQFVYPQDLLEAFKYSDEFFHHKCVNDLRNLLKKDHNYSYRKRKIMFELFYKSALVNSETKKYARKN